MFEDLKSRYITGLSASCRKARPFAAPNAIFILVDHGKVAEYPKYNLKLATGTTRTTCYPNLTFWNLIV